MNPYIRPRPTPALITGVHSNVHLPQHRNERSHPSPPQSGEAFPQYQTAWQLLQFERNQNIECPLGFLVPTVATTITNSSNTNTNNAGFQHYIPTGIHELSGAGGSGKTQLACSIVVQAAMTALTTTNDPKDKNDSEDIRAIYISMTPNGTQKVLQRIRQMISTRLQQQQDEDKDEETLRFVDGTTTPTINCVLRRIQIITCRTIDDWMEALWNENGLITQALTRPKNKSLRVVIVDSIADLFRHDDNVTSHPANSYAPPTTAKSQSFFVQRSTQLFLMTQRLHQLLQPILSTQHPLSVLILNQVTMTTTTSHWPEQPALGLTWSNCVHSRFRVQKRPVAYDDVEGEDHHPTVTTNPHPTHGIPNVVAATEASSHKRILRAQRTLTVTHSTRYPITSINFIITAGGCYPSPP